MQDPNETPTVPLEDRNLRFEDGFSGVIVGSRYRIERLIGSGGFGAVYEARDLQLHSRPVVVKLLLKERHKEAWSRRKFRQELEALARINHPCVVAPLDYGELPDGVPFLVMQFIHGRTLRALLSTGGMKPARIAGILRQIGSGLQAAHDKGVIHRDLKPENIMTQTNGDEDIVQLIDFGLASIRDSQVDGESRDQQLAGTIRYMAPEQFDGNFHSASDIYAFGVIAYELLTGNLPFPAANIAQLREMQRMQLIQPIVNQRLDLAQEVQTALFQALAFDPNHRPQSAKDFGHTMSRALLASANTPAGQPRLGRLVARMCNRRSQEDDFRSFLRFQIHQETKRPFIVIVHGGEGECHESLVDRLVYQIGQSTDAGGSQSRAAIIRKKIPWQYEGSLEARRDRLLHWLDEQLSGSRGSKPVCPEAISTKLNAMGARFIVIEHEIRAARWDSVAAPFLSAYLKFWQCMPSDASGAQTVVFVNVIYPPQTNVDLLKHWWKPATLLQAWFGQKIRNEILSMFRECNLSIPLLLLDELRPITRDDVLEWFGLHDICDSEEERIRLTSGIFSSPQESRKMAEIEGHLTRIHGDFLRERGYT